ncbi:PAS domain S-box protein [Conexibacter sp. W3-3-2]|uniref:PAS domain S-box protein n=1 Tax=Conexibacter sp. W3-3-2 TaxID=2675227 RepID=UPI0012B87240|nr:PAS domain S-box protein [Conexibacter sp. W3-3-2]MTD44966.1 PAS domain S-box protein [Conexibacter sp. W3-3-2]
MASPPSSAQPSGLTHRMRLPRRDRAAVIAAARLSTVPLACSASFALDDGALRDGAFLLAAAVCQTYATGVWLLVRRRVALPSAVVSALDVAMVLGLAVAAHPSRSVAALVPLILLFVVWSMFLSPRALAARGVGIAGAIVPVELVHHGVADAARNGFFIAVVVGVCAVVARQMRERLDGLVALERHTATLQADAEDLQRRERVRIAQLLHDDALQRLLAARQDLDGAESDPSALEHVRDGLAEATRALRSLTHVVHDDALEAAGLESGIGRIVDEAVRRSGLTAHVAVDPEIDGHVATVVLPILRELVANAERHAEASELAVELRREAGGLLLRVADDGRGFTRAELVDAERSGHLGHAGLRRRVADLQGELEIDTAPGAGCRVTVRLRDAAIEARRELESSLRREREWNAALVAGFPDPFIVLGDDARIIDVSDRFVALTGWTRGELLSASPGQFPYLPPETAIEDAARIRERDPHDDHTAEHELHCRGGRRVAVIVSVRFVQDPRGGRGLRLVTFKDITQRRETERRLVAERDLSEAIRDAMQEPFLQTLDGVVVAVNEAFCTLTGYRQDELIGARRPYFFIRTATLDEAFAYAARLDAEGTAVTELLIVRADGSEVRVRVRGVTVRDVDGTSLGRVQTAHPLGAMPPLGPRRSELRAPS